MAGGSFVTHLIWEMLREVADVVRCIKGEGFQDIMRNNVLNLLTKDINDTGLCHAVGGGKKKVTTGGHEAATGDCYFRKHLTRSFHKIRSILTSYLSQLPSLMCQCPLHILHFLEKAEKLCKIYADTKKLLIKRLTHNLRRKTANNFTQ